MTYERRFGTSDVLEVTGQRVVQVGVVQKPCFAFIFGAGFPRHRKSGTKLGIEPMRVLHVPTQNGAFGRLCVSTVEVGLQSNFL